MADGLFYNDMREPFIAADLTAISPLATNVALYTPSAFPVLGGQYFSRPGKAMRIDLFGRMTTALTPGNLTFAVMGLLLASRAENPQVVSGLINVASFPMYLCSGVFFSSSKFPEVMQPFIRALPLTALNDALRAVMIDGASLASVGRELAICAAWGLGCFALALRLFKWR